jgi:hypothetical protein
MLRSLKLPKEILMRFLIIDRVIKEEGFMLVYNMHSIVEKHCSISIVPVRIRGGSLVRYMNPNILREFFSQISFIINSNCTQLWHNYVIYLLNLRPMVQNLFMSNKLNLLNGVLGIQ